MNERHLGLLNESEIQSAASGFEYVKGGGLEQMTLRMPPRSHETRPLVPVVAAVRIFTLYALAPDVYDIETIVETNGQETKRSSTIDEMTALYQIAKHIRPDERITRELGYELHDSINRIITENKAQTESYESLKRVVGL